MEIAQSEALLEEPWKKNLDPQVDLRLTGPRGKWWWTGLPPEPEICPGVDARGRITSLPQVATDAGRDALRDYFDNTWTLTETLFAALQGTEAFYRPPYHHLRHPLIFYYAHPAVLYINKLRVAGLIDGPIDPEFEQIFETGVDEMTWDDMSKNTMLWPDILAVHAYRKQVYLRVAALIDEHPDLDRPVSMDSPAWALVMGFEHARIHLETSSVLIRELPLHCVRRPEALPGLFPAQASRTGQVQPVAGRDFPELRWQSVEAGVAQLGKPRDWPAFGWDNEYGQRSQRVRPFRATTQLVSNGAFFAFVSTGAYQDQTWWTPTGWSWRRFRNSKWPTFWRADGPAGLQRFKLRTVFEEIAMPWDWPVEVNLHEARAFSAWRRAQDGAELPYRMLSEAEHWRLRDPVCRDAGAGRRRDPVLAASGQQLSGRANLNLAYTSASPVDALPANPQGFHDVFGNVWQWLEDDFNPLAGFKVHRIYDDFSTPCFDGKHTMILGGSFMSTGAEASIWARFHFRPHFFQHAGFRLACSDDGDPSCDAVDLSARDAQGGEVYETPELLDQYLCLHYASPAEQMPWAFGPREATDFPSRCAQLVIGAARRAGIAPLRALDVGCAVGRASFELARHFGEVLGVDLSGSFIETAQRLQVEGSLEFRLRLEGELCAPRRAVVDPDIARERVTFRQADACSLPPDLVGYDAVLLANLLCRLPSPMACLGRMAGSRGLVRPGGLLVTVSPYTWMEAFTPREVWLGGRLEEGRELSSADGLKAALASDFELLEELPVPLVIREHARKFQYIVSHGCVWQRKT